MDLAKKKCAPCDKGMPPLSSWKIEGYLDQVPEWRLVDNKKIKREFIFKDFKEAMEFVNKVAEIAEGENHHPDIYIFYKKVVLELLTHAIGGLSENDFIVARKIDLLI